MSDIAVAEAPRDGTPADGNLDVGRIARSGALNLVGAAVSVVATFGLTVYVTRNFSKPVSGTYFALTSFFLILAAAGRLGTETGTVYTLSGQRARGEAYRLKSTMRVAYIPTAIASVALMVIVWPLAPWLGSWLLSDVYKTSPGEVAGAIRVFALCLPAAIVGLVAQAAARGLGNTKPYVLFERVVRPVLQLAGAVLVVLAFSHTPWIGLAASYSVPYLLTAALMLPWLAKLRRRAERKAGVTPAATTRADWTGFWTYSGPRAGTGMIQIALQRLDVLLIGALRGATDVALYAAATRFLVVGQTAANALSMTVQHRFSALLATGRNEDANRLYQMTTTWLVVMVWPFYLTWAVLAHPLMRIFGKGFSSASEVGVVLALSMLVATACGMVSMVLEMAGNTRVTLAMTALALVANIGVDLALIPSLGPLGAAIGWAVAILLNNLVPLWMLHRRHGFFPISRGGAVAMAASVVCFVGPQLVEHALWGESAAAIVAAFVLGLAVYAAVVWRARRLLELHGLKALRRRKSEVVTANGGSDA